ncbi:MAG TPA: glutamine--fructose-6-phosphate transaminase (isomerizing) [Gammaproteobacteria bacterium]|nr:glutamine--fructose-6-phosphate transaminase (isomerizing) [Gammaproteobacteria bacterium]
MCGLIGATGRRNLTPVLVDGLRRLEYRGYDSAGIAALLDGRGIEAQRTVGRVSDLAAKLDDADLESSVGIAHTRWATHGAPVEINAHPQVSNRSVAVVHNGIIENDIELRTWLVEQGYRFESDTDTEVIAHGIHFHLRQTHDLGEAVRRFCRQLRGSYAIAVIGREQRERVVVARRGSPLLVGVGEHEHFVASDLAALIPVTDRFVALEEGDVAEMTPDQLLIWDERGEPVRRELQTASLSDTEIDKGSYPHFMLKEIHEQDHALARTLAPRLDGPRVADDLFGMPVEELLREVRHVHVVACGTSFHAGLVARYQIEAHARVPCTVERASEYVYRDPVVPDGSLFVALSQSGETADTLSALRMARAGGYRATLAICNVAHSTLVREADLALLSHAGPEIGVASTKAFTAQLGCLSLLAVMLGRTGALEPAREAEWVQQLRMAPSAIRDALAIEHVVRGQARSIIDRGQALFLGRGPMYPVAQEGALKLKEISYLHAEAHAGGELKHGPLALVDEDMPVICLAPNSGTASKLKGNIREVQARGGRLLILTDTPEDFEGAQNTSVIRLHRVPPLVQPMAYTIPLQLLAYHAAVLLGQDVDKPRNLAKSVTVE